MTDSNPYIKYDLKEKNPQEILELVKESMEKSFKDKYLFESTQQEVLLELMNCLEWYVQEDDVIETMEDNEYWIEGKRRAIEAIRKAKNCILDDVKNQLDYLLDNKMIVSYTLNRQDYSCTIVPYHTVEKVTVNLLKDRIG